MGKDKNNLNKKTNSGDRFELFERVALEKLKTGSFTTNPAFYAPLPTRLVAITASTTIFIGVIWSIFARVPIQVNGTAVFIPEASLGTELAEVSGTVNFLVSGNNENSMSQLDRENIFKIENFSKNSFSSESFLPDLKKLIDISTLSSKRYPTQNISLNYLKLASKDYNPIFYKNGKFILQIYSEQDNENLKNIARLAQPKMSIEKLLDNSNSRKKKKIEIMVKQKLNQRKIQLDELERSEEMFKRFQKFENEGIISKRDLLQKKSDNNRLKNEILRLDFDITESDFRKLDILEKERVSSVEQLKLRSDFKNALIEFIDNSYSISPKTGMYLFNIFVRPGSRVEKGAKLYTYTLDRPKLPEKIPLFVNASSFIQIDLGNRVSITPKGISRSRFGGIEGTVTQISKLPLGKEELATYVGGTQMAQNIQSLETDSYMINIQLKIKDKVSCDNFESAQCYLWTSKRVPSTPVRLGVLADSQITVERKSPIEFLMPALRRIFGFETED